MNNASAVLRATAAQLVSQADLIDIGAESTILDSERVGADSQIAQLVPVIEALSEKYPKNKFSLRYYEAGLGYKGRFAVKGGQVLENYQGEYRGRRGG